jgi:hypothetical protein
MSKIFKNYTIILCAVFFLIGFFVSRIIKDVPYLSLNTKIDISALANLIWAVIVGLLIPLSLSPILTNKRVIKDFLIQETKDTLRYLQDIKTKIDELAIKGTTTKEDRLLVNSMISRDLDMKITSLAEQIESAFDGKGDKIIANLKETYGSYWRETTGGELMSNTFKFNMSFRVAHDKNHLNIASSLKRAIHAINNF